MRCDKCGCEHNSKSVCPKCGATVVYVNEEYEKRRREYLEAQKKGEEAGKKTPQGVTIPNGIHFSTEEEHNLSKGRDRSSGNYRKPKEEEDELKGFLKFLGMVLLFFKNLLSLLKKKIRKLRTSQKKKRGVNNPVRNRLEFVDEKKLTMDDGKETLDTSKLVLAHKVFRDKRKPILAGVLGGLLLTIGLIVFLVIYNSTDHTQVAGVVAEDGSQKMLTLNGKAKQFFEGGTSDWLAYTRDGKSVIYVEDNIVVYANQGLLYHPQLRSEAVFSNALLSDTGKPAALVGCINEQSAIDPDQTGQSSATDGQGSSEATDSNETYLLYVGNGEAWELIYEGTESILPIEITEDGYVIYEAMQTAAYGMIAERRLMCYQPSLQKSIVLDSGYTEYFLDTDTSVVYCLSDGMLREINPRTAEKKLIDEEVLHLIKDQTDSFAGILYEKKNAYYHISASMEAPKCLMTSAIEDMEIFYYKSVDQMFAYQKKGDTGVLYQVVSQKPEILSEKVSQVVAMEKGDALLYVTDTETVVMTPQKNSVKKSILPVVTELLQKALYSQNTYYLLTKNNQLRMYTSSGEFMETRDQVSDLWII